MSAKSVQMARKLCVWCPPGSKRCSCEAVVSVGAVRVYLGIVDMVVQACHHVCMSIHTCIQVPQIAGQDFECVLCLAVCWLLVEKNGRERHHTPQAVFNQLTDPAWSPPSATSVCHTKTLLPFEGVGIRTISM